MQTLIDTCAHAPSSSGSTIRFWALVALAAWVSIQLDLHQASGQLVAPTPHSKGDNQNARLDEHPAITKFRKGGGVVEWVNKADKHLMIRRFNVKECRVSLSKLEVVPQVKTLTLHGYDFDDEDLRLVSKWTHLEALHLIYNHGVTDNGMKQVESMSKLKRLILWDTQVSSAGMKALSRLTDLEHLEIQNSPVGDIGLDSLKNLKKLRVLYLFGTKMTQQGADRLAASLPGCKIEID
jgi:hypothetical protein